MSLKQYEEFAGAPERTDAMIETGLEYQPGDPVRVRVIRRGPLDLG